MNTRNELQKYVDDIAADLRRLYDAELTEDEIEAAEESGEAYDLYSYTADALDIEYILNSSRELVGVILAVALGGPNVYIDTRLNEIRGYWGTEKCTAWLPGEIAEEITAIYEGVF